MANGNIIKPALRAALQMPNKVSSKAQSAHVFNDITSVSLISMEQLCDDDCVAIFTKFDVKILQHNQVIITSLRDRTNGLRTIPLELSPHAQRPSKRFHLNQANGIICHDITKRELAQYFHAAAFSPVKSTFITAINNSYFTSWPGLSASLISKHLLQYPFTVKVHLEQAQKNLCSTRSHQDIRDNIHPKQDQHNHNILAAIIDVNSKTSKSYSDQTGRFLILSSRRNQYIFILYNYDTNSIDA